MNFFLDTSVLFKLFVQEEQSERYCSILQDEPSVHVSPISWVEFHYALRKLASLTDLLPEQRDDILTRFKKDWNVYSKVRMDKDVLDSAATLVSIHALKTLDSIQLASALDIRDLFEEPFVFLTADKRLEAAARKEKLQTHV